MPKKGETEPSLAFHIKLSESRWREELQELIEGIHSNTVPQRWLITPDAKPKNIVDILKAHGFLNLSENAEKPEPGMMLNVSDFRSYPPAGNPDVVCREVRTKEDFSVWVKVVNTALHGWEMIDAEHYSSWIEQENIRFYLAEIDGIPVSSAATIQTGILHLWNLCQR